MLLPEWIILILAVLGVTCFIFDNRRWGTALLTPALLRWVAWPSVRPYVSEWIHHDINHAKSGILLLLAPVVLVFGGIWILGRFVGLVYGRKAGANVASEYLVRVFDGIGGGIAWLIRSLLGAIGVIFRAIFRRRQA